MRAISEFGNAVIRLMKEARRFEVFSMGGAEEGSVDGGIEKTDRGLLMRGEKCEGMGKMLDELMWPLVQGRPRS